MSRYLNIEEIKLQEYLEKIEGLTEQEHKDFITVKKELEKIDKDYNYELCLFIILYIIIFFITAIYIQPNGTILSIAGSALFYFFILIFPLGIILYYLSNFLKNLSKKKIPGYGNFQKLQEKILSYKRRQKIIDPEEITLEKAWEIIKEFGRCIEKAPPNLYDFEDKLPYDKEIIFLSFLIILSEENFKKQAILNNTTEKEFRRSVTNVFYYLNYYIPTPKQYEKILKTQRNMNEIIQKLKKTNQL